MMMKRTFVAAVAAGGLLAALAVPTAQALPMTKAQPGAAAGGVVTPVGRGGHGGGHGFHGGGHGFHGGGGGHHGHHHGGLRFRGFYAAPFVGYGGYYAYRSYGGGCGWLRRRAEATGSPYWWRRYEDCVDDNY